MGKDDQAASGLSTESCEQLEDVKKGKPRKFAMICKGNQILSLVVYKKGNIENRKKEAKLAGAGQFYFGVVDGKGIDIRFALARSNGFEAEPTKNSVLKGFLEEKGGLKVKPYFEVVDSTPWALDEDNPLVVRFLALQPAIAAARGDSAEQLPRIDVLNTQIGGCLDREQYDEVPQDLDALEKLLGARGDNAASTSPVDPQSATTSNNAGNPDLAAKLIEALKKLKPLLDSALENHPGRKVELVGMVTAARDSIRNQLYDPAQSQIIALGKLLKSLVTATGSSPESKPKTDEVSSQVAQRLRTLTPQIKAALSGTSSQGVKELVDRIKASIAVQDFAAATRALDLLVVALGGQVNTGSAEASADAKYETSFDHFPEARLQWEEARTAAIKEIDRLKLLVSNTYKAIPQDGPLLANALNSLDSTSRWLSTVLRIELDRLLNVEPIERDSMIRPAKEAVSKLIDSIQADPILSVVDENEYDPSMRLAKPMLTKLATLSGTLS